MKKIFKWLGSPMEVSMWWYVIVMTYFSLQLLDWFVGMVFKIVK